MPVLPLGPDAIHVLHGKTRTNTSFGQTDLNESAFMQKRVVTCCVTMIRWRSMTVYWRAKFEKRMPIRIPLSLSENLYFVKITQK